MTFNPRVLPRCQSGGGPRGCERGGQHGGRDHGHGTAEQAPWSRAQAPKEPSDERPATARSHSSLSCHKALPLLPPRRLRETPPRRPGQVQKETGKARTGRAASVCPGMRNAADTRDAGRLGCFLQRNSAFLSLLWTPGMPFSPCQPRPCKGSFGFKATPRSAAMPIRGSLTQHRVTPFTGARKPRDRSAHGVRKATWSFATLKSTPVSTVSTEDAAKGCFAPAAHPDELGASPNAESEEHARGEAAPDGPRGFSRRVWWSRRILKRRLGFVSPRFAWIDRCPP